MSSLLPARTLDALANRGDTGLRAFEKALTKAGWSTELREVTSGQARSPQLWELAIAEEPAVLIAALKDRGFDRVTSLGYTRQARYTLSWTADDISLHDTLRWRRHPGDLPLFTADLGARGDLEDLLRLVSRDEVINEAPTDLVGGGAVKREELPKLLGRALRRLRVDVAETEAYQGRDPAGLDTAVLRLFHQLLFVRVTEDRGQPYSSVRIRDLANAEEHRPNDGLSELLEAYRSSANSELFEPWTSPASGDTSGLDGFLF